MSENATASRSASASDSQSASDIDKILAREATAFQREVEVERILKAFKLKYVVLLYFVVLELIRFSPYDMLDLTENATPDDIKRKYRQLSLCKFLSIDLSCLLRSIVIHPDKCPHERAPEAFDLLKKVCSISFLLVTISLCARLKESSLTRTRGRNSML